jgi:serine O-acetyltransferase
LTIAVDTLVKNKPMPTDPFLHLDIAPIVADLRVLRLRALEQRQRHRRPPKLPSRHVLKDIIDGLATVLYPNRLGTGEQTEEGIDYYVGHTLDAKLRLLMGQIQRELLFGAEEVGEMNPDGAAIREQSVAKVRGFVKTLPKVRALLDSDLQAAYEGDPAARSIDEVLVCYPGIAAIINHRLAHELYLLGLPLIARMIAEIAHSVTGIDIHPGARIGSSFFIDHGTGVVIGETCIIGERVRLYQAVTLGAKRFPADEHGVLIKGNARHPIVEDDVVIYSGATILGRITIGKGSTIGGNVWLTRSVPPNSNITQAQARQEWFSHGAGI